jgi:hypothetical protein
MPRVPDGVIAHPSAPQFSSSQAVMCVCRFARHGHDVVWVGDLRSDGGKPLLIDVVEDISDKQGTICQYNLYHP